MYKHKLFFFGLALIASLFIESAMAAMADTLLCEYKLAQAAVPQDAYYLPETEALQLQKTLDKYNVISLKPNGDYRRSLSIKLKSNQAIFGLAATKLPNITITPGTQNVIISDIESGNITFPTSDLITSKNCFNRIRASIEINNTKLENNLFTDIQGGIVNINNSKSGYIRNNRFIKTMTHTASPALTILGNQKDSSYGNHFVWTNILGPVGDSVVIDNQKDITFTGLDVESWSWVSVLPQNLVSHFKDVVVRYPAAINVFNTDYLSIFMSHGGNLRIPDARYFNLDAKNIFLQGSFVKQQTRPGLFLGKKVEHLLAVNTTEIGAQIHTPNTILTELFKENKPEVTNNFILSPNGTVPIKEIPYVDNILQHESSVFQNWKKPVFSTLPNPAGSNWAQNLSLKPDDTAYIQALIDKNNIAVLGPRAYYITRPLELKTGQGIQGAGTDKTVIIAKNKGIDIIVGASQVNTDINDQLKSTWFVLTDLTLQGGKSGIHHSPTGSGKSAQYHRSILSHVTFRNMSDSAIFLESIYGWDNNFLDNINFIDCATGIKQRPDPLYTGGDKPGTTYMDKNVCYRCRFENNSVAIDMPGKRGNGLNAFINNQFINNKKIIMAFNPISNFFANSIFIDNAGNPSIETNYSLGFVHSEFTSKVAGSLFRRNTLCSGCKFTLTNPKASLIETNPYYGKEFNYFINSSLNNEMIKLIDSGLLLSQPINQANSLCINKKVAKSLFQ
jgi:hypothetical protein